LVVTTAMTVLPLGVNMSAFYFLARERTRQHETILNIVLCGRRDAGFSRAILLSRYSHLDLPLDAARALLGLDRSHDPLVDLRVFPRKWRPLRTT
jgi:hypothetical protein